MTPQEKANALVFLYVTILDSVQTRDSYRIAKRCARITVDEILSTSFNMGFVEYWQQVKTEIEKL